MSSNQIGKTIGVPVAEFYIISFFGDITFVTKNFVQHEAPIDLQHIYHFRKDDMHSVEGLIDTIKMQTGKPSDVSTFIQTILFDALIGNHDRHGRNLAFIKTAKQTRLSPIYDNVSYLSLESGPMLGAHFNPTGKIRTLATSEPSMADYVLEIKRLNYHNQIMKFEKALDMQRIQELIVHSYCSEEMKQALQKLINRRYEEFIHG